MFYIILLLFSQVVFAQNEEEKDENNVSNKKGISIGLGPELNMNSREGFAYGAGLGITYQLPVSALQLAAGLTVTGSYNLSDTFVAEAAALFRWYFLGVNYTGFFVQADLGMHFISERSVMVSVYQGGLRAGMRVPLSDSFFIEPYGRFGIPYFMGAGLLAGIRIRPSSGSNSQTDSNSEKEE